MSPTLVSAQGPAEQSESEYRALIDQALDEFKHKNWPEARVLFRRAHELSPNARTLRGMGIVSYEMRDYVNAVVQLTAALADARQPLTDAQRKECEGLLARSRTFVGAYALKVEPPQADVTLDGSALVRDAEGRILVPFGEHTLRATAPGYQDNVSKVSVQGGEQGDLRVVLYEQKQNAVAQPTMHLERTVELAPPEQVFPTEPPRQHEKRQFRGGGLRYSWIALGATAALGASAAATWFVGQGKLDDLDSQCAQRANGDDPCRRGGVDTGSIERFERTTNALLGLTGAALVATVVLTSFEWPRERQKLALDVGPNRISLRGSF